VPPIKRQNHHEKEFIEKQQVAKQSNALHRTTVRQHADSPRVLTLLPEY